MRESRSHSNYTTADLYEEPARADLIENQDSELWHVCEPTLVFTVQLLSLVIQIFLCQMLNVQESLDYLVDCPIYECQSQVTESIVRQALLEGANGTEHETYC